MPESRNIPASSPVADDRDLAARVRAGDVEAFRTLFDATYQPLFAFVHRHIGQEQESEDIIQDIFLDIWRRRADWAPAVSVRAYLYGAARNQIASYYKRARVRSVVSGLPAELEDRGSDGPESMVEGQELQRALQDAVDELPEQRRLVFTLYHDHGLRYREIAQVLGIAESTVQVQMWRSFHFLRDRLSALRMRS